MHCCIIRLDRRREGQEGTGGNERPGIRNPLSLSLFRAAVPHSHAVYVRIDEKKVEVKEEAAFTYGIFESHLEKGSGVSGQPVRRLAFIISHLSLTFSVFLS